jgi:toxin YoeB
MASDTKIVWHPGAKSELVEILEFYNQRNGSTEYSDRLLEKIEYRLSLAGENCQLGEKISKDNVRRTVVENFLIYFLIDKNSVDVLSIRDGRRKPKRFKLSEIIKVAKPLTPKQLEDIEVGRRQIAAGEWVSHEDFMKELDKEFPDDGRLD